MEGLSVETLLATLTVVGIVIFALWAAAQGSPTNQ